MLYNLSGVLGCMVAATLTIACAPQEKDALAIMMQHESEYTRCSLIHDRNNELIEEFLCELEKPGTPSENSLRAGRRRQAFVTEHFDNCWAGWKKTARAHFEEAGLDEADFEAALKELNALYDGSRSNNVPAQKAKKVRVKKRKSTKDKEVKLMPVKQVDDPIPVRPPHPQREDLSK